MADYLLGNTDGVLDRIELRRGITIDDDTRDLTTEVVGTVQAMCADLQREGHTDLATKLADIVSMATEALGAATDFSPTPMDELSVPHWVFTLTGQLLDFVSDDVALRPDAKARPFREREKQRISSLGRRAQRNYYAAEHRHDLEKRVSDLQAALDTTREDTTAALERLDEAQTRTENVLQMAENAAGDIGTGEFQKHFVKLEADESDIANKFRNWTMVGIGLAIVLAALSAAGVGRTLGTGTTDAARWVEFASHLTIVAGVGALTAYLGRQSGQHRRTANWAQSVAVQLRSFPALAAPASGTVEDALYVALANRVLAAPPEKGVEPDNTGVTSAQVMDIVLAAMKKTQTTT